MSFSIGSGSNRTPENLSLKARLLGRMERASSEASTAEAQPQQGRDDRRRAVSLIDDLGESLSPAQRAKLRRLLANNASSTENEGSRKRTISTTDPSPSSYERKSKRPRKESAVDVYNRAAELMNNNEFDTALTLFQRCDSREALFYQATCEKELGVESWVQNMEGVLSEEREWGESFEKASKSALMDTARRYLYWYYWQGEGESITTALRLVQAIAEPSTEDQYNEAAITRDRAAKLEMKACRKFERVAKSEELDNATRAEAAVQAAAIWERCGYYQKARKLLKPWVKVNADAARNLGELWWEGKLTHRDGSEAGRAKAQVYFAHVARLTGEEVPLN